MIRTTINWYTPDEKTPDNGEVVILKIYDWAMNLGNVSVYNGHFNCSSDDTTCEIFPDYWANINAFSFQKKGKDKNRNIK